LIDYPQETTIKKILLTSWIVKGEIALGNKLGFQAQIEDLRLKCGIHEGKSKNSISAYYKEVGTW